MRDISMSLSAMSLDERRELPCIGHERADLVVAGCAILECILDIWPAERLGVADRGIREGILRGLMERDGIALCWVRCILARGAGAGRVRVTTSTRRTAPSTRWLDR